MRVAGTGGELLIDALCNSERYTHLYAPCGGNGRCGKCKIQLAGTASRLMMAPPTPDEMSLLSLDDLRNGWRLACRARFLGNGTIEAELPSRFGFAGGSDGNDDGDTELSLRLADEAIPSGAALSLAVDLGTTTVAATLFDVDRGMALCSCAQQNNQRKWGPDVISRIESSKKPGILDELRNAALSQIDELCTRLIRQVGRPASISGPVIIAGNTTMLHIVAGVSPASMGEVPFLPAFLDERILFIDAPRFPVISQFGILLMPGISAFVGADIVAGILATRLYGRKKPTMLIDIGTNGEIALKTPSGIYCTAAAAGPAFEGACIECGVPSIPGAIDHAGWDGSKIWHSTIGGGQPVGICGSGLLDIIATLFRRSYIDKTGRLAKFAESGERPGVGEGADSGERSAKAVAAAGRFFIDHSADIFLTQADIRQVQLAKAAIACGITILCRKAGIELCDIDEVFLAGTFGNFLDRDSALAIGLVPEGFRGKMTAVGNTSLAGAVEYGLGENAREMCRTFISEATAIEMAEDERFQQEFVDAMSFPSF